MQFRLNTLKAAQAASVLIRTDAHPSMNFMRLLKLLYIADRESLRDTGSPIVGGRIAAMERGPVLDDVYALIKSDHVDAPVWNRFFSRRQYELAMTDDPGVDLLSRYDVEKLQEVARRYVECDEWDMVLETHTLPEWQKNDPGRSSKPIPYEDVLEAVGRGDDIPNIEEDARLEVAIDDFFADRFR